MRNYLFLLIIFISCGPEARMFNRTFVIKNGLEIPVKVNIYLNEELKDNKTLLPDQVFKGNELETDQDLREMPNGIGPLTSFKGNIIEVIYNNEKKSISTSSDINNGLGFFSEPAERNLLRTGNYEDLGNEESQFTITQQDFDNATPCDGPCE